MQDFQCLYNRRNEKKADFKKEFCPFRSFMGQYLSKSAFCCLRQNFRPVGNNDLKLSQAKLGSDQYSSTVQDLLAATAGKTRQQDHYHPPAARFDSADNS
jgi:hypothetical protein